MSLKENLKEKIEDIKFKARIKTVEACDAAKRFYYDHETEIRAWAPVITGGVMAAGRMAVKHHKVKKEEKLVTCRHWDPRKGSYYWSKRPLKPTEQLALDDLYDQGYSKGEALRRMGLLRY